MRLRARGRMLVGSIVSVVALVLGLVATAATPDPPKTPDPFEKIRIWEGRWKIQVQRKETLYSHASSVPYSATCSWLPNRGYMVCDYLSDTIDPQEGKVANHLSIFTYSDKDKAYKHLGISMEGEPHEQLTIIEGNVWTTPFEVGGDKGEKLQCRNVYEFVSPEKQISRFEISADDGQHWTLVSESVGAKVH
jgi:hypothetical protein